MRKVYTRLSLWILKNLNWLYPILSILILAFSFLLSRCYLDKHSEIFQVLITTSFFLLGGYFTLLTYKINHDKLFKELFTSFNSRFDRLNESLNKVPTKKQELKTKKREKIVDYINLCSEEYMWYKKGRIDTAVWKAWKAGIEYYLQNENINDVFKSELSQRNSYYGLFDEFDSHFK